MLTWAMHLTLLVPGLFWPREILRDITFDLPLPALSLLAGRGRRVSLTDEDAWLAHTFALDTPIPAAALRLLGDGGHPEQHDWLCLDPIHLRLEELAVIVDHPARLALTIEEDQALREAVAPLFASVGVLVAAVPGQWHLRLAKPVAIETLPLTQAAGHAADPSLPGGSDGPAWRRLLAEAQLVLHAHPVNRARDEAGRPTVNSLWPWGAGRPPTSTCPAFETIWCAEPLFKGLAALTGAHCAAAPARFLEPAKPTLVKLPQLSEARAAFDTMNWREAAATLEADWLAPALTALRRGHYRSLTLVAATEREVMALTTTRRDLWRFWRPPVALAELAP
jgi:hypothetical protein